MRTAFFAKLKNILDQAINPATEDKQDDIITALGTSGVVITTPLVVNVTMTNAATEYNYSLPANCKAFVIKLRSQGALLQLSFASGQSGTTYITIPQNDRYESPTNMDLDSKVIYFQSPSANQIIELIVYT
jgi:hypothetical protein